MEPNRYDITYKIKFEFNITKNIWLFTLMHRHFFKNSSPLLFSFIFNWICKFNKIWLYKNIPSLALCKVGSHTNFRSIRFSQRTKQAKKIPLDRDGETHYQLVVLQWEETGALSRITYLRQYLHHATSRLSQYSTCQ